MPEAPKADWSDLSRNAILADLPEEETRRLLPHLQAVSLRSNDLLSQPEDPVRYVYFPNDAVISLLASMEDGRSVEVGLTGDEGLVGVRSVLGAISSGFVAVAQVPGGCLRMKTEVFQSEFRRGGVLHHRVLRYILLLLSQVSQTAVCNRLHRLEQRLARWLLLVHDRVKKDEFSITHEFLSQMLGTPRSEVTVAVGILRAAGMIRDVRGKLTILDRQALEAAACECYRVVWDDQSLD